MPRQVHGTESHLSESREELQTSSSKTSEHSMKEATKISKMTTKTTMSNNTRKDYYIFPSDCPSSDQGVACNSKSKAPAAPTLSEVGGKALSLIDASTSFPVPPGLVLTVTFFETWLEQIQKSEAWKNYINNQYADGTVTKELCDAIKKQCENILSLDDGQIKLLEEAVKLAFGPDTDIRHNLGIVAVRSSSPEEDLVGSSFAGGYETSLGVTSDNLQSAIIHSFASLFDHRIHLYKVQHGMDTHAPRIAIIIQRQIASEVSGVGFSINPNNNCYDETVISANFGLGESVVGGVVTPDTYIVDRFDPKESKILSKKVAEKASSIWLDTSSSDLGTRQQENKTPNAQALTDAQILEVANLVARVEEEEEYSLPVDIEWAYDKDGRLYLLKARPVTAYIPIFPEMITERGQEKKLYLDVIVMVSCSCAENALQINAD